MSVTESKAKAPVKTSKKSVNPAESAALKAALEAAQVEMVPLSALVKSPLNVRTIPYPADSVREMADSIMAIGLIQNLVVHSLPDGMSGVAAGGRRLAALQQLLSEQRIDAGYLVVVKRVSDDLAVVASMVENNQRVAMHPAEQISGFRTLSEEGKTPAQIGDLLGYSARHVQRMLKLANLAPELITLLAEDKLDVEQCQALSLESDPARQVQVYDQVKTSYGSTPAHLLGQAVTELNFQSPETVISWYRRWAGEFDARELAPAFWHWRSRYAWLASLDWLRDAGEPLYGVMHEISFIVRETPESVRQAERWQVPNKLTHRSHG